MDTIEDLMATLKLMDKEQTDMRFRLADAYAEISALKAVQGELEKMVMYACSRCSRNRADGNCLGCKLLPKGKMVIRVEIEAEAARRAGR